MKGLLIKDFCLLMQQKKILALILFLAVMLNYNSDGTFVIGYLTFVCAFLALGSISYDEYDNGYAFLFTLPIGRKSYVRSKYLFAVMVCVASWLTGCLVAFAFFLARNQMGDMLDAIQGVEAVLAGVLIFLAVLMPLKLKYGADKGKIAMLAVLGICCLSGYLAKVMAETAGIAVDQITDRLNRFWTQNIWIVEAGMWTGTVLILGISYLASVAVMKRKEF